MSTVTGIFLCEVTVVYGLVVDFVFRKAKSSLVRFQSLVFRRVGSVFGKRSYCKYPVGGTA